MSVRVLVFVFSILVASTLLLAQTPANQSPAQPIPLGTGGSSRGRGPNMMPSGDIPGGFSTGTIEGSMVTSDGRPVRNSVVELHDEATGSVIASTYTELNGSFAFDNVPEGRYEVVANRGVDSARERVEVHDGPADITLRINGPQAEPGSGNTISVAALQVPQKAKNEFQKASQAFMKQKIGEAEKHVTKALKIVPQYAEALTLRGLLKFEKGDVAGAEQDFQNSIASDPNYGLAYFAMGAALNTRGQFPEAQHTLQEGLRYQPDSWQGYFELSKAVLGQHDFRNALKYVVKAESFGANYATIHLVKAHALLGLKDYDEAASELERYLSKDSTSPQADQARRSLSQARSFSTTAEK